MSVKAAVAAVATSVADQHQPVAAMLQHRAAVVLLKTMMCRSKF